MVYEYICSKCEYKFEENQPMLAEHKADCPECGSPAIRQYSLLEWIWAGSAFRSDGSRREDEDYAILKG